MPAFAPCAACGRTLPEGSRTCPWDGTPARRDAFARGRSSAPTLSALSDTSAASASVVRQPTRDIEPTVIDSLLGRQLGDYVIRERLGQGGMGIVYAGEQPVIGKRVAIKVLRPEIARDPEQVQRLLAEARAVNAIRHRGIIDIFNFGQLDDGRNYVVMEYLDGQALDKLIADRGSLAPAEAMEILEEVLSAAGVVAFEMLTGKLPFDANAPIDFVLKHLEAKPPPPSSVTPGIPRELDALVLRLLEKQPLRRPSSCEAVRREIARIRRALSSSSTH